MRSLHLDLKPIADNYVELRFFEYNQNQYQRRSLPLDEIADLIQLAERDYYVSLPEDYAITGRRLYNWLDGSERFLQRLLERYRREGIVLAISAAAKLAHLPWEVLHALQQFSGAARACDRSGAVGIIGHYQKISHREGAGKSGGLVYGDFAFGGATRTRL